MHNYHSATNAFPISTGWGDEYGGAYYFSDKVMLLPYLERTAENLALNPKAGGSYLPGWSGQNPVALSGRLPVFNCPSNTNELSGGTANFTYAINMGTSHNPPHTGANRPAAGQGSHNGIACYRQAIGPPPGTACLDGSGACNDTVVTFASVIDGTSNTAAYSEFVIEKWYGNAPATQKGRLRAQVFNWAYGTSTEEVRNACLAQTAMNDPNAGRVLRGAGWSCPWIGVGGAYAHNMMPNEKNCHSFEGDWYGSNTLAATSEHPGGVNVGMADGSIKFQSETTENNVWWAMGTRARGEQ
jgi:prepilin-type processing-associated H-X9-DG protein